MAVYKRNYRAYSGPVTPHDRRWMVITRHSLASVFSSRASIVLFVLCMVPPLVATVTIYVANSETARTLLQMDKRSLLMIDNRFFWRLLEIQGWLALFLTAWIGPGMVSPDLTNGGLPLFLSRPISRAGYIAGKILGLVEVLSAVTWVPLLFLFFLQAALSKEPWLGKNLFVAGGIVLGSLLWIAILSLIALAVSAYVRWRIVATGLMIAIVLIPSGFGAVINAVLRTSWGMLLNVPYTITLIWSHLLRAPIPLQAVPVSAAWISLLIVCVISLLLLNSRVQARQVVRG